MIYKKMRYILYFILLCFVSSQSLNDLGKITQYSHNKIIHLSEKFRLESQIDTDNYLIGPGDKIGLTILASENLSYILTITPTGHLWIPDLGKVYITDLNIKQSEVEVQKYIKEKKFKDIDITLALLNIKSFNVQVTGAVLNPGFISIYSMDRLASVIDRAGGLHKLADESKISIVSKDGREVVCSLKDYLLNGDLDNNPLINNGDIISISYEDEYKDLINKSMTYNKNSIFTSGFVVRPGAHRYYPGYTINDYIAMSGGYNEYANSEKLIIYRNSEKIKSHSYFILEPGDRIYVSSSLKYKIVGNMSILQSITAMLTLYLTFIAAMN